MLYYDYDSNKVVHKVPTLTSIVISHMIDKFDDVPDKLQAIRNLLKKYHGEISDFDDAFEDYVYKTKYLISQEVFDVLNKFNEICDNIRAGKVNHDIFLENKIFEIINNNHVRAFPHVYCVGSYYSNFFSGKNFESMSFFSMIRDLHVLFYDYVSCHNFVGCEINICSDKNFVIKHKYIPECNLNIIFTKEDYLLSCVSTNGYFTVFQILPEQCINVTSLFSRFCVNHPSFMENLMSYNQGYNIDKIILDCKNHCFEIISRDYNFIDCHNNDNCMFPYNDRRFSNFNNNITSLIKSMYDSGWQSTTLCKNPRCIAYRYDLYDVNH
ncbi:hypothetical protein QLL95_gp1260 [Cotonvirus japonicus]|uniref:Uncharacterized protein n=1 Tax=Cotonvirus japonicus TaxID=2811091 RepID=A0ABM7NRR8_9VIRU|nr:hypothetical protein QLL95_gp1260 [Cotonvirus japonicus]BCS82863.1 hypothetical protein [Cotonvirus japonicus]